MKEEPKVSIITAIYNGEKYISETLACLLDQNYTNWENIVVDDGSTDDSAEIIRSFVEKDNRYKYFHQENQGAAAARNMAIRNSTGKYILPLDADDLISKDYVREAVEILGNHPEIKLVYCNALMFGNKKGPFILPEYSFKDLIIKNMIINSSMYRRSDYDLTTGYDSAMFSSEDWEFWISLLKTGGEVYKIAENHWFYRRHADSKNDKYHHRRAELRQIVYQKHKELYSDLFDNPIQTYIDFQLYKKYYNFCRRLSLRKPVK